MASVVLYAIASTPEEFIDAIQSAMDMPDRYKWLKAVDLALAENSWDRTVEKMLFHINSALEKGNK